MSTQVRSLVTVSGAIIALVPVDWPDRESITTRLTKIAADSAYLAPESVGPAWTAYADVLNEVFEAPPEDDSSDFRHGIRRVWKGQS